MLPDPGRRTANRRLSGIALARGEYEVALAYAQAAHSRDPSDPVSWQLLGDAYLALGRQDEAFAWWSRVPGAAQLLQTEALVRSQPLGDRLGRAGPRPWPRGSGGEVAESGDAPSARPSGPA